MPYTSLVLIHASTMAAAIALTVLSELLLLAARSGRGGPARMAFRANRVGSVLITAGLVSGIAVLVLGGWPLWTPWLLVSLALIVAMAVIERRFVQPWQTLSAPVLRRDAAGPGIRAVATDTQGLLGRMAVIALFAAISVLMVVKPTLATF
ncbi:MAG: hypothetical protein ACREPV_07415 [Lysobacter sp.]